MERKNKLSGVITRLLAVLAVLLFCGNTGIFAQEPDSLATGNNDTTKVVTYTKKELRRMHRDSVWNYKDSVLRNTPRLLNTYVFDDTTKFKRMFLWNTIRKSSATWRWLTRRWKRGVICPVY